MESVEEDGVEPRMGGDREGEGEIEGMVARMVRETEREGRGVVEVWSLLLRDLRVVVGFDGFGEDCSYVFVLAVQGSAANATDRWYLFGRSFQILDSFQSTLQTIKFPDQLVILGLILPEDALRTGVLSNLRNNSTT